MMLGSTDRERRKRCQERQVKKKIRKPVSVLYLTVEFGLTPFTESSPKGLPSVKISEPTVFRAVHAETPSKYFCSIPLC